MGLNHVCTVLKAKSFLLGKTFGPWLDKALTNYLKYFFEEMEKTGGKGKNLMNRYFRKRF